MKYFLDSSAQRLRVIALAVFFAAIGGVVTPAAMGELPSWIRNIEANSAVEAIFFPHDVIAERSSRVSPASERDPPGLLRMI